MPNYLQRKLGHDYTAPSAYLITVVTEGRSPLLGSLVGDTASEAAVEATMNGVEFLKKLREQKLKTEVIMVTAANDTATLEETMHLGVIDYLVKPFALERFQVALEKFTAKMNAINGSDVLDQNLIDSIISNSPQKKSKEYPKGIQEKTLERIKTCFENKNDWHSVELIAEKLGISIVTVRHYVNYLVKEGFLQESINYETGGRPSMLYKKN